jgi:histidyl-tRNA synthetase
LQYANKQNIPYVIIVGADERERGTVLLRNMHSREEQQMTIADAIVGIGERESGSGG